MYLLVIPMFSLLLMIFRCLIAKWSAVLPSFDVEYVLYSTLLSALPIQMDEIQIQEATQKTANKNWIGNISGMKRECGRL